MSWQRTCDHCGRSRQRVVNGVPVSDVIRYTLRREADQTVHNGRRAMRRQMSAGGLDLCGECWEKIAKPRMNPNKGRKREAVA